MEPNPELYGRLASLAKMTIDGLKLEEIYCSSSSDRKLYDLYEMLLRLKDISEKELTGTSLADDDYAYIRNIGEQLESLTTFSPGG